MARRSSSQLRAKNAAPMASSTAARTARLKASFFRFYSILSPAESTK